ncbi:unnamed protein product [Rhizophagus irregularis]|nr:unnamed protein product [Rhizophagus irregularis]
MSKSCLIKIIIISLAIFFGVFFGVNYPEIKRSKYTPTICQSQSSKTITKYCCDIDCTCEKASSGLPKCETLVPQTLSLSPIGCNQNSTLCPKSGSDALCYVAYDECYNHKCLYCKYVKQQKCQMNCDTCYDIILNVMYNVGQQNKNSTYTQNFKSIDDANKFLNDHGPNNIFWCFYNPSSITEIILNRYFTGWRWVVFALSALPLFVCLVTLTNLALYNYIKNDTRRFSVVFFIWIGIIIPLVILLNVWKYGLVSKGNLKVLMVFILILVVIGTLPIMIKFLIACEFTRQQIISLSFIGLIIPLIVYVPIILYVPSSKNPLVYILNIQLLLVILTIISKRIGLKDLIIKNIMYL